MRLRVKKRGCLFRLLMLSVFAVVLFYGIRACHHQDTLSVFKTGLTPPSLSEEVYPRELIALYDRNPEAREFVLNYPKLKSESFAIDLSEYENSSSVPLLLQWDKRWGYQDYGSSVMGVTGCGPTCLSMVAIHLLSDASKTPAWMAEYSTKSGYCVPGNGTAWELMSTGAKQLGLTVTELPLVEKRLIDQLSAGHPIIAVLGPGDFTDSGHFIVLTGYKNGKFTINDPNSPKKSEQLWEYSRLESQIRNLWAYSK